MTDTDKLTDLLRAVECGGNYDPMSDPAWLGKGTLTVEEAHKAILDLFKSLVPDEILFPDWFNTNSDAYKTGKAWNGCRSQLLANIERLRQ